MSKYHDQQRDRWIADLNRAQRISEMDDQQRDRWIADLENRAQRIGELDELNKRVSRLEGLVPTQEGQSVVSPPYRKNHNYYYWGRRANDYWGRRANAIEREWLFSENSGRKGEVDQLELKVADYEKTVEGLDDKLNRIREVADMRKPTDIRMRLIERILAEDEGEN